MGIDTTTPAKSLSIDPVTEPEKEFNWQQCWYPVTFVRDLPIERPISFSLYNERLVLFKNSKGQLSCLRDRCPHRAAKLSDGQIIEGKIECLYHGWQFGSDGQCTHIPQLSESATIPRQACVQSFVVREKQGIIWLWAGKAETADEELIPTTSDIEQQGVKVIDTVADLPYDQNYLVENLLDPAHVPISHDRTELKMKRENAQPLEMEILSVSAKGFQGRYRNTRNSPPGWAKLEFIAPGIVFYSFGNANLGLVGGLALYAFPWGEGRSRLLVRRYGNFFGWWFKHTPRWLEHLRQNKILEQDLDFIRGQEAYFNESKKTIKEVYLPLKTIDTFVIEHRKWLDRYGQGLPYYQGYTTSKQTQSDRPESLSLDRLTRHTQICSSCSQAYTVSKQLKQTLIGVAIALAALAIVAEDGSRGQILALLISLLAIVFSVVVTKVKTKFEHSFTNY